MYAVIEATSNATTILYLMRGAAEEIAHRLIADCDSIIDAFEARRDPGPDLHTDFYAYQRLLKNPSAQNLKDFTFDLADIKTDVVCLASDFDDLAEQFEDFKMGYENLFEWRMIPPESDAEFEQVNQELISLSQGEPLDYTFFMEE